MSPPSTLTHYNVMTVWRQTAFEKQTRCDGRAGLQVDASGRTAAKRKAKPLKRHPNSRVHFHRFARRPVRLQYPHHSKKSPLLSARAAGYNIWTSGPKSAILFSPFIFPPFIKERNLNLLEQAMGQIDQKVWMAKPPRDPYTLLEAFVF